MNQYPALSAPPILQTPAVHYDVAALQVKIMCLAMLVEDLQKTAAAQAEQIQRIEEYIAWNKK